MASTQKKTVLRMHDGNWLAGYLPAAGFIRRGVSPGLHPDALELLDPAGLLITPPDTRSNTQRIFLPRTGITELTIVSVIGASNAAAPKRKPPASDRGQADLFPAATPRAL